MNGALLPSKSIRYISGYILFVCGSLTAYSLIYLFAGPDYFEFMGYGLGSAVGTAILISAPNFLLCIIVLAIAGSVGTKIDFTLPVTTYYSWMFVTGLLNILLPAVITVELWSVVMDRFLPIVYFIPLIILTAVHIAWRKKYSS